MKPEGENKEGSGGWPVACHYNLGGLQSFGGLQSELVVGRVSVGSMYTDFIVAPSGCE